jgi:hypothetical protein
MSKDQYSLFKQIDIFGISPLFTIRGRATFQTQIGSFLTLMCIFIILIYILIFLNEMTNHKSPNIQSSSYFDEIPPEINLHKNNFTFIFSLQTKDYTNYIDESIYNVNAFQTRLKLNNGVYTFENEPLNITKCNEFQFDVIPEHFKKLPLQDLYCLNNNINIRGEFMNDYWNYIKFNFSKCENLTNKNNCKPENEINELLNGGYIGIFMTDYSFEPSKFYNPYRTYVKNVYKSFSIQYFEDIFLYLKLIQITTDSGYFFEEKKSINLVTYDYIQNDIDFRNSKHFLSLTLRASSEREIFQRSYIKLQTIFSNVGGMLKIILLIGEYSVYIIRMTLYKNYILEFFNLDESEIRLKKIREKFNLPKNNSKGYIETINYNTSNLEGNNTTFRLIHKQSKNVSTKPKNDKTFEERTEIKNNYFLENYSAKKNVENILSKNKESKKTSALIFRGKSNNVLMKNKPKNNLIEDIQDSKISNLNPIQRKSHVSFKKLEKSKISNLTVIEKHNSNSSDISYQKIENSKTNFKKNIFIPKPQLRIIKVPGFCSDFVCKKDTFYTIKQVHSNYKEIQFLLDIVHYLKSQNEINIIEKYFFNEEQRKALSYTYSFEADFALEREGYEYMIKHNKNKFDDKESNETNSQNHLIISKK